VIESLADAERFLEGEVAVSREAQASLFATRGDSVRSYFFDKEIALADDPHRYVSACCGRRAGKTTTVAGMMLRAAMRNAGRSVLYLTITRDHGKGVIWGPLKQLNEQFALGGVPNESELTLTMPNGATIAIRGVDKRKEIEKRRGYGFALVVIDECQSIPEYVRELVDEVLGPALMDVPGRLVMIGTPALIVGGFWFECHHSAAKDEAGQGLWGHHYWTVHDNPHIVDPDAVIAAEAARRGVPITHASMQREYFGRWIRDESSAVFAFDPARNTYLELPKDLDPRLWAYVISIDIGGGVDRDKDAVIVLAFHPHRRATWLAEEHVSATLDVTDLAELVTGVRDRLGNVVGIVADTGGIGAKVAKEMQRRYELEVRAAKKQDKWANIALLNTACRHAEFFAPAGSQFATECVKVEKDWAKSTPDRIAIKGHMPDVCDGVLYGYVESLAWISKAPPPPPPAPGTEAWGAAEAKRMEDEALEQWQEKKDAEEDAGWESWEGWQ
jgi:hypothetical protein